MKITAAPTLDLEEDACLGSVAELQATINQALVAISRDSLEELEGALWHQQVLCATLQRALYKLRDSSGTLYKMEPLVSAFRDLYALNATYTELLRQANATTDLLQEVCRGYQERPSLSEAPYSSLFPLEA